MNAKYLVILLAAMILGACGGGGTITTTTVVPVTTAEGIWRHTGTSFNQKGLFIILENGEAWEMSTSIGTTPATGSNDLVGGVVYATTSGTALTGSVFDMTKGTVTPAAYSFIVSPKNSLTNSAGIYSYDASYDQPASLTSLSGTFAGYGGTTKSGNFPGNFGISSLGVLSVTSATCSATGSVTPRPSGKNIFNVSLTFTGTACALGNNSVATGIASYDATQVRLMVLNSAKSDGYFFVGSK